tara:strand:+ start:81 stop:713 length:633 start_codon:yes stop_codon:yes gene_type:complete
MKKVILQPTSSKESRKEYFDTIECSVSLSRIKPFVSTKDFEILKDLHPNGECKLWGIKSSTRNINKWNKIKEGDLAMFVRKGKFFATASVTHKVHSPSLANEVWGSDDNETWEFIYFVKNVETENLKQSVFNNAVGYKDNFVVQGFSVLNYEKSFEVLKLLYSKPIKKVDVEIWYGEQMECLVKVDGKISSWSQIKNVEEVLNYLPRNNK